MDGYFVLVVKMLAQAYVQRANS